MSLPDVFAKPPVSENVLRGTLLASLVLPVGVVLWVVLWSFGWIASIVAFGIALGASLLYRLGSGGVVSRIGAFIITGIVFVTVLVSFYAGMVSDFAAFLAADLGITAMEALGLELFWPVFNENFPLVVESYLPDFAISLLFAALGSFGVIRAAFMEAKAGETPPVPADEQPPAPV